VYFVSFSLFIGNVILKFRKQIALLLNFSIIIPSGVYSFPSLEVYKVKVAVAVLPNGMVNAHFGRANKLALATVENGQISKWEEVEVPFAESHGDHDHHHDHDHHDHEHHHAPDHHEGIKNFLVEQGVDMVLLDHAGPGMQKVMNETDIKIVVGAKGNAKEVVQAVIDQGFSN